MGSKKYIFRDVVSLSSNAVKILFYHGVVLCGLKFVDKPEKILRRVGKVAGTCGNRTS